MNPNDIRLETERLILRSLNIDDAKEIHENIKDKDVSKWTANVPYPYTLEMAHQFIEQSHITIENNKHIELGIVLKDANKLIGVVGLLNLDLRNKHAEIGYWLGKNYWGKGFMPEAAKRIIKFGFNELDLHKIYGKHIDVNTNSKRIFEKLGFTQEGLLREQSLKEGIYYNKPIWSLLRDEFFAKKS